MKKDSILVLQDGTKFSGVSIGYPGTVTGEIVFNTSCTGYQEVISDPSYYRQFVVFTCSHIGNVGCNKFDQESDSIRLSGVLLKSISSVVSNWRSEESLLDYLKANQIVAMAEFDTRALTCLIRKHGSLNACLMAGITLDESFALNEAKNTKTTQVNLAKYVSTKKVYTWSDSICDLGGKEIIPEHPYSYHVVVIDFGVKKNILRWLVYYGCKVTVVPMGTSLTEIMSYKPDGVLLSNGPGDPSCCKDAIRVVEQLLIEKIPIFGICLGLQILALASGCEISKMKFGHHGTNHPVHALEDNLVLMSSQNHNFVVSDTKLPSCITITHRSLFDNTLQGLERSDIPAFGFQGHPEAGPGPNEYRYLFEKFINIMH